MRRFFLLIPALFAALSMMVSCGGGNGSGDEGQAYLIKGSVALDSSMFIDNKLVLFTDNHRTMSQDSIALTKDGTFEFEGHTNGFDELYLCGAQGELCRFYAAGSMEINLSVVGSAEGGVKTQYLAQQYDSINIWLQEKNELLATASAKDRHQMLDSLISASPSDLRVALLLRDQIVSLNDSLYIRQSLGSLSDEAKPDWMKKSIDNTLNAMGSGKKISNTRLQPVTFELADTIIDLSSNRSDYLLVCFWADYSQPSIDTLRTLSRLIQTEFDQKRVSFLSCCLHAEDSAMFRVRTNFIEGSHTWVKGGFSDPRIRAWNVTQVPSVILMDMYCNQTQRDIWGEDLRRALNRIPNRIGFQKK